MERPLFKLDLIENVDFSSGAAALGLGHVDEDAGAEERQRVHHSRRVALLPLRHHRPQHEWIFPCENPRIAFTETSYTQVCISTHPGTLWVLIMHVKH